MQRENPLVGDIDLEGLIAPKATTHVIAVQNYPAVVLHASEVDFDAFANVYPNPNSGQFILELKSVISFEELRICQLTGKTMRRISLSNNSRQTLPINIEDLPAGLYLLVIETATEKLTKKLVKF